MSISIALQVLIFVTIVSNCEIISLGTKTGLMNCGGAIGGDADEDDDDPDKGDDERPSTGDDVSGVVFGVSETLEEDNFNGDSEKLAFVTSGRASGESGCTSC